MTGDSELSARRERWLDLAALVAVAAVAAWSFWLRYRFLTTTPYPVGIDGYFYPIQLRSLLGGEGLHFPSSPLTLWWMTPFAALTDPITGAKLGAALGVALIALPVYGLGRRFSGDRWAGVLAAVVAATGAGSFYLSAEFVKNGVGLTVAATALLLLLRALDRPTVVRLGLAGLGLAATFLAHKMAAGLVVVVSVPAVVVMARRDRTWARLRASSPRVAWLLIGLAGLVVAAVIGLGALAPKRVLGLADLDLFSGIFGETTDWSLPALTTPGHTLWFGREPLMAALVALAALAALLVPRLVPLAKSWRASVREPDAAMAASFAVLAIAIGIPWLDVSNPDGLPFRLRVAAFLPLALGAAVVAGAVAARFARDRHLVAVALIPFAAGWLYARSTPSAEGVVRAHPAMVAAVKALDEVVPDGDDILVPERHIMFMAIWYTGNRAQLTTRDIPPERRWRLLTLAFLRGPQSPLAEVLERFERAPPPGIRAPRPLHPRHPVGLVVMPEATWQRALDELQPEPRAWFERWRTI